MHKIINLPSTLFCFLFALLIIFNQFSLLGMEESISDALLPQKRGVSKLSQEKENKGLEKIVGTVLALQKKLACTGRIIFEDGSLIENFPGLPADVLILIAGELAKSGEYTSNEKIGIFFSLVNVKEFQARKEALIHCLYKIEKPKDVLDAVCLKPLEIAYEKGYSQEIINLNAREATEIVSCLLDGGADPSVRNNNGETALMMACQGGDKLLGSVKRLMTYGADPNAKKHSGQTVFMFACEQGDKSLELVKYLMASEADPRVRSSNGTTALMVACQQGNKSLELVKYLMANRVDAKAKTNAGSTALSIARRVNAAKLIAFLENN